jgi:general stress protein 26
MNDTDLQTRVREALERTDIMALSTIDHDGGPWTSPVQYQSDSQLNLYFASMPDARHVRNIQRDARVAVADLDLATQSAPIGSPTVDRRTE